MALGDTLRQAFVAASTDTPRSEVVRRERTQELLGGIEQAAGQPGFNPATNPLLAQLQAVNPAVGAQTASNFMGLERARQQAMFQDAFRVRQLMDSDPEAAIGVLDSRLRVGDGDMSDTQGIRDALVAGNLDEARQELDTFIEFGQQTGMLEVPGKTQAQREQELANERETLALRRAELDERIRKNQAGEFKLSDFLTKTLDESQTAAAKAAGDQRRFRTLASDFGANSEALGGGVFASWGEALKDFTGDQDAISNLRKEWNAIRTSQATANLPPGVASDKDIELALSGFPAANANAQAVQSFLRGQEKLAKNQELFNTFKSDFISTRRGNSGLLQAWNRKYQSETLDRPVTMADIVETSLNNGVSIQEVMEQLGIE